MTHANRKVENASDGARPDEMLASPLRLNQQPPERTVEDQNSERVGDKPQYPEVHRIDKEIWLAHDAPRKRKSHGLAWLIGIVILLVVLAIVFGAIWMNHLGSTVASVQSSSQQNGKTLASQGTQLSGIQTQLHHISNQLSQMQNAIRNMFTNLMAAIHRA